MIPSFTDYSLNRRSFTSFKQLALPGSTEELEAFSALQSNFCKQFQEVFPDQLATKTVVVVPSLTLDIAILTKVKGHVYYEERMLCLLMLLRMPRTNIIYLTSTPIDEVIIDYYLHLLPGITGYHARQRLTLLSCFDNSDLSLTEKVLKRPRLIERIRDAIVDKENAHIACFNVTDFERTLSVRLEIPLYGCDPALLFWGSKSGSREIFRSCDIPMPPGFEHINSVEDVIEALYNLKLQNPSLRKAVVKLNDGFSGEGNAIFSYKDIEVNESLKASIAATLPVKLQIIASDMSFLTFMNKLQEMNGIVEAFIDGEVKTSPSVQCIINPMGKADIISTHDQLLDRKTGQIFLGAQFPANDAYNISLGKMGLRISEALRQKGVLGRFAIDFISVKEGDEWKSYAIEINLRKGGTTHPYLMLQYLTDGNYDSATGTYLTASGQQRFYFASDNLQSDSYQGLTPRDLIDIAIYHNLMYDGTRQEGVMFHLMGALSQYGKLGVVCIGSSHERAMAYYNQTIAVLDKECE
jgi:hypothetical protein